MIFRHFQFLPASSNLDVRFIAHASKLSEGLLLTFDQEDYFRIGNKTIHVKPVWKWSMEASTT